MKSKIKGASKFRAKGNPIVEMDTEAGAAYVRFSRKPIVRTIMISEDGVIVTADCDAKGGVIGVDLVGVRDFTITRLGKLGGFSVSDAVAKRTRYVSAAFVAA